MSTEIPCPPPRASASVPRTPLPANACDCHAHVFGPADKYPYQAKRDYTPPDAPLDNLLALHDTLGIQRCVLTQPSVLGVDNRAMLDAVSRYPGRLRAVVAFGGQTTEAEIDQLHQAGARGLRVNLVDRGGMPFQSFDELEMIVGQIAERGWQLELLAKVHEMSDIRPRLEQLDIDVVLAHYGYMPTTRGVSDPEFAALLSMMRDGRAWVKMTGGYRITQNRATPYDDIRPFAEAMLEAAPQRVLWGSDWPHVMCRIDMPDDGQLLSDTIDWIGDETLLQQIFVDNPQALYGF
jgi:predicted TIM-barrel fold metal-dependent hydrolase